MSYILLRFAVTAIIVWGLVYYRIYWLAILLGIVLILATSERILELRKRR